MEFIIIYNCRYWSNQSARFQVKITLHLQSSPESGKITADFGTLSSANAKTILGISFGSGNSSFINNNINFLNYTESNPYTFNNTNSPIQNITNIQSNYSNKQFIIVLYYQSSIKITSLVGQEKSIQLISKSVSSESFIYQIVSFPENGSLVAVPGSNGKYMYTSNKPGLDFFTYVTVEGQKTSDVIRVNITNYSQSIIASISRKQGTFSFDNVSFDGDNWRFGTFTTDTFIQNGNNSRMGNFEFYNQ